MSDPGHRSPPPEAATPRLFWVSRAGARLALIGLHLAALLVVLMEVIHPLAGGGDKAHAAERIHELDFTASYAIYGFVACVLLVLLGIVLRRLVMRDENFYRGERT